MNTDEYLKLAEVEDQMWYFRSVHAHVRRELVRAGLRADGEVLDAGCGTGGLSLRLRQAWPELRATALDYSPLACELARRRCGSAVAVREGSVMALPFPDASFDAVAAIDVISQVDDPVAATRELFRVLRPGGVAVMNVPAYMWMWSYHDQACRVTHRYTRSELRALLENAGYRGVRLTHWNSLTFPLIWARRKLFHRPADTSDVKLYPAPLEAAFNATMALEHAWIDAGGNWAWGNSVFASARKDAR